jgi:hypothetical protein
VHEVGEHHAVLVLDGGPLGHRHEQVVAAGAVHLLALAVGAVAGAPVRVVLERDQGGDVAVRHQPHAPAGPAVAAVGTASGRVRLAPERDRSCATVASLDVEAALVDELRHPARLQAR